MGEYNWVNTSAKNEIPNMKKGKNQDYSSNFSHSQPGYHTEGFSYQNTSADGNQTPTHVSEITIKLHKAGKAGRKDHAKPQRSGKSGEDSKSANVKSENSKVITSSMNSVTSPKGLMICSEGSETESTGSSKNGNVLKPDGVLAIEQEAKGLVCLKSSL